MKLDEVSRGSIYVDTNILYMYLRIDPAYLSTVKVFLSRIVRGEIEAFVSIPVLDELFYRLLLARIKETTDRNPLEVLRQRFLNFLDLRKPLIIPNLSLPPRIKCGVNSGGSPVMSKAFGFLLSQE